MSQTLKERLFDAHLADLEDVIIQSSNSIYCPICFNEFNRSSIQDKKLSDGHIWPKYIRSKHKSMDQHRILLCKNCNSKAGTSGDAQMQESQKLKDGETSGNFYGLRKIQFPRVPHLEPITLNAFFTDFNKEEVKGNLKIPKSQNSPKEMEKYYEMLQTEEKYGLLVHPYKNIKEGLPQAGWITSAYLFAYYHFGYRYIFQSPLEPIRKYIFESFTIKDKIPSLPDSCSIYEFEKEYVEIPELLLVIPFNTSNSTIHFRVNILNYQINLPLVGNQNVLKDIVNKMLDHSPLPEKQRQAIENGEAGYAAMRFHCTKTQIHKCKWDYLLGKPKEQ